MFELLHQEIKDRVRDLWTHLDKRLDVLSHQLTKLENEMALNFDSLKAAVQSVADGQNKLSADQAKAATDITAAIAKLGTVFTADPADQATIDSISSTLQGIVTSQQASAAALEQSASDLEKAIA